MLWSLWLPTLFADVCPSADAIAAQLQHSECPTLALLSLQNDAETASEQACVAQSLQALGFAAVKVPEQLETPPPGGKMLRDAYGLPNMQESENFVLRWGNQKSMSSSRADDILETFESAWSRILVDMDYVAPQGSDTYKFNVYIGSSGNGGPQGYGAAYYTGDPQGYPMIVVTQGTYKDLDYGRVVGAHEFFHALQGASGSRYEYSNSSPGAWYWEATANWVETEIYPEERAYHVSRFLIGFAFFPHLPVGFFDYPDGTGGFQEYHQYGAFIFPYYITREIADADLIRNTWLQSDSRDPLDAIDAELQRDWQTDVNEVFFDFAGWNTTWSRYDDGEVFAEFVAYYEAYYPQESERIVAEEGPDSDGWQDAPRSTLPHTFGTNYVTIEPDEHDLLIEVELDEVGDRGGDALWDVRVVVEKTVSDEIIEIPLKEREGQLLIADTENVQRLWLVASVVGEDDWDEQFGWSYRISISEDTPPEDTGEGGDSGLPSDSGRQGNGEWSSGCSCSTTSSSSHAAWLLMAIVLGWMHRTRRH